MQKMKTTVTAFLARQSPAPARHRIFPTEDSTEHIARLDNMVWVIIPLSEP